MFAIVFLVVGKHRHVFLTGFVAEIRVRAYLAILVGGQYAAGSCLCLDYPRPAEAWIYFHFSIRLSVTSANIATQNSQTVAPASGTWTGSGLLGWYAHEEYDMWCVGFI